MNLPISISGVVFTSVDQVANIVMPDGCRIIALMYGMCPQVAPIEEPGEYLVDAQLLGRKARFPIAIMTVDLAHVADWQALSPETVGLLLDTVHDETIH